MSLRCQADCLKVRRNPKRYLVERDPPHRVLSSRGFSLSSLLRLPPLLHLTFVMAKALLIRRSSADTRLGTFAIDAVAATRTRFLPESDYSSCAQDCMQSAYESSQCPAAKPFPCFCQDSAAGEQALNCIASRSGCDSNDIDDFQDDLAQCNSLNPPADATTFPSEPTSISISLPISLPQPDTTTSTPAQARPSTTMTPTSVAATSGMTLSSGDSERIASHSTPGQPTLTTSPGHVSATAPLSPMSGSGSITHSPSNISALPTAAPSGSSQTSFSLSPQSLSSGAVSHSADPTTSNNVQTTLPAPSSHGPSKLLVSLCAALAFIILAMVGLFLICKRRRRRLRPHAPSAAALLEDPTEKSRDAERLGVEHESFTTEARFRPSGDLSQNSSELTLTPPHRRASDPHKPSLLISSAAELSPPLTSTLTTSPPIATHCPVGELESNPQAAMDPPAAEGGFYSNFPAQVGIGQGHELEVGDHDHERNARSLPPQDTVNPQPAISTQCLPTTAPASIAASQPPSHPPFNQYHDDEKDAGIPRAVAGLQEQAPNEPPSQHHPRSDEPHPPSVPSPTAARDPAIALPLPSRFSTAGSPPHPRFVAVLMELQPDVDSDEPPPYHPARLQDPPPSLS
ncbi:hypothetical protein FKP32DRAFT_653434 [Trametes sanguinea]|nr:hypothetical protein FKP32DRAFT_653434 [Trametes sanguinea]